MNRERGECEIYRCVMNEEIILYDQIQYVEVEGLTYRAGGCAGRGGNAQGDIWGRGTYGGATRKEKGDAQKPRGRDDA